MFKHWFSQIKQKKTPDETHTYFYLVTHLFWFFSKQLCWSSFVKYCYIKMETFLPARRHYHSSHYQKCITMSSTDTQETLELYYQNYSLKFHNDWANLPASCCYSTHTFLDVCCIFKYFNLLHSWTESTLKINFKKKKKASTN